MSLPVAVAIPELYGFYGLFRCKAASCVKLTHASKYGSESYWRSANTQMVQTELGIV